MILVAGLGNPGKKYRNTRHNIGFRILDEFLKESNFPKFKLSKKIYSLISEGEIAKRKVLLVKPQTFMNNSGKAIKALTTYYKLPTTNLIVVHDDIDLPLGKIKIVKNRGSAGHKGVESIIKELGAKNFVRIRIGIQPKSGKPRNPEKFVLQNFTKKEEKILKEVIKKTSQALKTALREGLEKVMTEFNK
ncbi:MAG: aminoacyl-tRNA hydrolase [Candidatus Nealsonbacteria bacterium]|nr:MAG: aminoacyl-tRNA hydrolase [Candidatus Nealsonbacteria bacterium]